MLQNIRWFCALAVGCAVFLGCSGPESEVLPQAKRIIPKVEEAPAGVEARVEPPLPPVAVLGGPCLGSSPETAHFRQLAELRSKALRAERAQDWADAVLLTKDVVRGDCSNEHWWFKLAEFQMKTGSPADAVATLAAFDELNGNAVERRLHDPNSPLHTLLTDEAYRSSALAGKIAKERVGLNARRAAAVKKLATVLRRPPETYVAKGACPFECCMYGEWTATEATKLYREPESKEAVATIPAGKVDALGGEMLLRPTPVLVRHSRADLEDVAEPGTIVFLLDYKGEGHGNAWINGEVKAVDWTGVQEHCAAPSKECWGEVLKPEDAGEWLTGVWWIQIKTKDGTIGWTSDADHFTGKDGCS